MHEIGDRFYNQKGRELIITDIRNELGHRESLFTIMTNEGNINRWIYGSMINTWVNEGFFHKLNTIKPKKYIKKLEL